MKLKDMVGVIFKKDEYVNIWQEIIRNYNKELVWNGEASEIPEKYLDKECTIFPFFDRGLILKYQNCLNIKVQK